MEKNLICEYEEKLRNTMINGDGEILDKLSFVSPFGQIVTKEDDIDVHRSGIVNITESKFLNQKVVPLEDAAVTITQAKV